VTIPKKVLLVGKSNKEQMLLNKFLAGLGIETEIPHSLNEAADRINKSEDFILTLAQLSLTRTRSLDFLNSLKSFNPNLGIVLLDDVKNLKLAISLIKKGIVDHFVSPHNLAEIFSAINNEFQKKALIQKNKSYLKKIKKYHQAQQKSLKRSLDLETIHETTLDNLMTALDVRDVETFGHSRTVAKYSLVLANILGIKEKKVLNEIKKGALLHDVGKIAIPDAILKKTSSLTNIEWKKIKLHPSLGFGLIKEIKHEKIVGNIILHHHERYDGDGYPEKLDREKIPFEARIFAVSDALDAITSHRPYRKERDFKAAKKEIKKNAGTQFDPQVVEAFCSVSLEKWEKIRFETTRLLPAFYQIFEATKSKDTELQGRI
jgi:putative nucleotidyltransferase with HDIG domain